MGNLGYVLIQLVPQLPTLAVLLAGGLLASSARDRLSSSARRLLLAGLGTLLLFTVITTLWSIMLPWMVTDDPTRYGAMALVMAVISGLLLPLGLGLLIAAALSGRRTASGPDGASAGTAPRWVVPDPQQPPTAAR